MIKMKKDIHESYPRDKEGKEGGGGVCVCRERPPPSYGVDESWPAAHREK